MNTVCSGCLKYQIPGAYAQAIADLTTAISIDRSCPLVYFNRALCFHTNRQYLEALRDYTTVLLFGSSDEDVELTSPSGTAGPSQAPTGPPSAEGTPRGGAGTRNTTRTNTANASVQQQRTSVIESTPRREGRRMSALFDFSRKESRRNSGMAFESMASSPHKSSQHPEFSSSRRFSGPVEPTGPTKEKLIIFKVLTNVYSNCINTIFT